MQPPPGSCVNVTGFSNKDCNDTAVIAVPKFPEFPPKRPRCKGGNFVLKSARFAPLSYRRLDDTFRYLNCFLVCVPRRQPISVFRLSFCGSHASSALLQLCMIAPFDCQHNSRFHLTRPSLPCCHGAAAPAAPQTASSAAQRRRMPDPYLLESSSLTCQC